MPKLKKSKIAVKDTINPPTLAELRKLFKSSSELAPLAPYLAGGIKVIEYLFNAMDAANTVAAPCGIKLSAVEVSAKNPSSKKSLGEISVANWIIEAINKQIS